MTTTAVSGRNPPRVSIVVPSFNQGRFLREAIDSILDQDYPDLEVLVMDGGSTDESLAILQSYGDRIVYESGPDGGQAAALNRGFEKATGQVVAWLNSDDRYCPGAIANAVAALEAEPDAGFVYGEGELIGEDGKVLSRFSATHSFDLWRLIRVIDFIMQPAVFMRALPLRDAGFIDESLEYGLDWDLWIRLALRRPVVYCPSYLAQSREHGSTKTSSGGFRRWRELRRIISRYGGSIRSPAVMIYGLDTCRRRWPTVFGPRTVADRDELETRFVPRLFRPVHRWVARLIDVRLRSSQGIFADRWVTSRSFFAVPWSGTPARLVLIGDVPAPETHFPLALEIRASSQRSSVVRAERGDFEVVLDLAADSQGRQPLEVEMRASRVFRAEGDPRRLAFRVKELRLTESETVTVVRPFEEECGLP